MQAPSLTDLVREKSPASAQEVEKSELVHVRMDAGNRRRELKLMVLAKLLHALAITLVSFPSVQKPS